MTWEEFTAEISQLDNIDTIDRLVLGYSTLGQEMVSYHVGNYDGPQILIEAGIHAREYPASLVATGIMEYLATIDNLAGGVYCVPIANPDGIRLVLDGNTWLNCPEQREYVSNINSGSEDYSLWKANIWAVDLNVNFDAMWGGGAQNVFCPAPGNWVGYYPNSEREVRNLIDFTYSISPALTLSYHTKGEVIFYGFESLTPEQIERDLEYAKVISSVNGYLPTITSNSTGGYSDWVSMYLEVPAFTVEVGSAMLPTPIPLDVVPNAIELNRDVPIRLLERLNQDTQQ
ncbi:MAG: hypothetical protein E7356_05230 [Clostridiales bacterium]|nr:hypothetical protein [Clostridiales bacterium]